VREVRNCWKELDNIKAFGCIFLPHYLIHICFSFLYECYLSILYDSLITYIVSYQIFLVLFLSSFACVYLQIFLHKPRDGAWIALEKLDLQYLKGMF
jgi:hypothetical protein